MLIDVFTYSQATENATFGLDVLIEAARKRNWNAIQFTTADALQEALK